jgi:choline-sulfatase
VDAQVGRLLQAVADGGLPGATVVAVAADHGEALGEHGEATHGMLAYDGTLRVPLVIADVVEQGARTDATPLSLTVLPRLLLTAAGLPAARDNDGHVYAESWYPRRAGWHPLAVLVDQRWKMILSGERELYDIHADPGERINVAAAHPSVADAMAAALEKLQVPQRAPAPVAAEAKERLRALGYVSGAGPLTAGGNGPNPADLIAVWTEFERALDRMRRGPAAAAVPVLERIAEQHADAPLFLSTYAAALKESGRAVDAVAVYRRAVQAWPGDASLFHDLAVAAREAGDSVEAGRAEQAALALDANSPMALNGAGLLHVDAGRMHDAERAFLRATQLDPTNASYWTNLGNVRFNLSAPDAAIEAYRKALGVDPAFPDALNGIGTVLVQTARPGDAVPFLQRALAGAPDLHEARLNLGIAYQESGQKDKAADTYREILKTTPARFARERTAAAQLLRGLR